MFKNIGILTKFSHGAGLALVQLLTRRTSASDFIAWDSTSWPGIRILLFVKLAAV